MNELLTNGLDFQRKEVNIIVKLNRNKINITDDRSNTVKLISVTNMKFDTKCRVLTPGRANLGPFATEMRRN